MACSGVNFIVLLRIFRNTISIFILELLKLPVQAQNQVVPVYQGLGSEGSHFLTYLCSITEHSAHYRIQSGAYSFLNNSFTQSRKELPTSYKIQRLITVGLKPRNLPLF